MRGIILERSRKGCIILTDEGVFKEIGVWKSQWDIGKKITLSQPLGCLQNKQYIMMAATLVLLLLPLAIMLTHINHQVAAYYTIDINPSIELGVSSKDIVVSVTGKNHDGTLLLQNMSLINLPIEKAIYMIAEKAYCSGYIKDSEDNDILLAQIPVRSTYMTGERDGKSQKIVQVTRDLLNQFSIKGNIHSLVLTSDVRKEAEKKGVSAGKFAILLVAEEKGMNITDEDIQSIEIRKIVSKAGMDYYKIVEEAEKVKDFAKLLDDKDKKDEKITENGRDKKKQNGSPYDDRLGDVNEKDQGKNNEQNVLKNNFHKDQSKQNSKQRNKENSKESHKQNELDVNKKENKSSSKRNETKGTTIMFHNNKLFFSHPASRNENSLYDKSFKTKMSKKEEAANKGIKKKINKKIEDKFGKKKVNVKKKQNQMKGTKQKNGVLKRTQIGKRVQQGR